MHRAIEQVDLVLYLLAGGARMNKHQDPAIKIRRDVARPFYFIRPYVAIRTEHGVERKHRQVPLGFCDEMTMKQAKAAKQEYMAGINTGKTLLQAQIPFSRLVDLFNQGAMPLLGVATVAKYEGNLRRRILPAFGKLQAHEITTQRIQVLLNESKLGWYAKADLKNTISAVFTHAKAIGLWSAANPCMGVRVGSKTTVREKSLVTPEQFESFLSNIKGARVASADEARLMILTAAVSGLRISEILGLQPQDLDAKAQTMTARRRYYRGDIAPPKTETSRTRYVGPLMEALTQQANGKKADAFLFSREDGHPPTRAICSNRFSGRPPKPRTVTTQVSVSMLSGGSTSPTTSRPEPRPSKPCAAPVTPR